MGEESEGTKTFLIDLPVMILFGALFSLFSDPGRRCSVFSEGYFWHGVLFSSLFNVAVLYAAIHYPDWMWGYFLTDSANTTGELVYLFVFLYYLPYALGYYLGRDLKRFSWVLTVGLCLVMAAVEGWLIYHLFDRYSVIGTRGDFLAGKAVSLFSPDNPIGPVMNGAVVLMIIYFLILAFSYRKKRRLIQS